MVEDTWKTFELSGKISDYLTYRKSIGTECDNAKEEILSERGMDSYGTERGSDRDGSKCNADWRI